MIYIQLIICAVEDTDIGEKCLRRLLIVRKNSTGAQECKQGNTKYPGFLAEELHVFILS